MSCPLSDPRQWTMDSVKRTIKNSGHILQFAECLQNVMRITHSASCKMNNSPFILRPCRRINYILGQIYVESYILIVSKSMQMVIIYQMQNSSRMYNSRQILIIFCPSAELNIILLCADFNGFAIHSTTILQSGE